MSNEAPRESLAQSLAAMVTPGNPVMERVLAGLPNLSDDQVQRALDMCRNGNKKYVAVKLARGEEI